MNNVELMYITNKPDIAEYAQKSGVDRIFIDLEINGKQERQGQRDTVISNHSMGDIVPIRQVLDKSKLLVRINPFNKDSRNEIDRVVDAGADIVMLPMFRDLHEVSSFVSHINGRAKVCLLLETPQAMVRLDQLLEIEGIDEVHIGLNDLHLAMGLTFMFELLSGGIVDYIANTLTSHHIKFGFGGMARMKTGLLPAESILCEHHRLGSSMVILSREFHGRAASLEDLKKKINLPREILNIRAYEKIYAKYSEEDFLINKEHVIDWVRKIVEGDRN